MCPLRLLLLTGNYNLAFAAYVKTIKCITINVRQVKNDVMIKDNKEDALCVKISKIMLKFNL
jgi:hypothetical protein